MAMMHGFEELECGNTPRDHNGPAIFPAPKCGSKSFVQVQNLIWRDGSGMTVKPAGYQCAKCGAIMDAASGIAAIKKQHNLDKIKELEAQ